MEVKSLSEDGEIAYLKYKIINGEGKTKFCDKTNIACFILINVKKGGSKL